MKHLTFLASCLSLTVMTATAANTMTQTATKSYTAIVTADNARPSNAMAKASDGCVFTSGVFDTAFEGLEPITASSYIIKSDLTLTPTWKVAIQGSATVTAMLGDADGGVYVGGNLADEVVFNGTDGQTKTVQGYMESGAYTVNQCAAFLAHYDKDGKLLAVNTIVPTHNADLDATGMYFAEDGDVYCNVSSLAYTNGTLYAALSSTHTITTTDGSQTFSAGSYDAFGGGFWYAATKAAVVAEIDGGMNVTSFPVYVKTKDFSELISGYNVTSSKMTGANGHLCLGLTSMGTTYLTIGDNTQEIAITDDTNEAPTGLSVIDIDLTAKTATVNSWKADVDYESGTSLTGINEYDGGVIVTGYFRGSCPFNTDVTANGYSDVFAAKVSSNGKVDWATASAYTEETEVSNKIEELTSAATVIGNKAYIGAYVDSISGHALSTPLFYSIDLSTGAMEKIDCTDYISGLAAYNGTTLLTATQPATMTDVTFSVYDDQSAGINGIVADKSISKGKLYNLNGQRIVKPKNGLYIKDGKKCIVE